MKRRLVTPVLFLPLLACLLGADSINWDPGQPLPNPGGLGNTLDGAGPYAVDPANTFSSVHFFRQVTGGLPNNDKATAMKGLWYCRSTTAVATYDCWGTLTTTKGGMFFDTNTSVVNVTVK